MEKDKMSTQLKFRAGAKAKYIVLCAIPRQNVKRYGAPSLSNPLIIMAAHRSLL